MVVFNVRGVDVDFPFEPYPCQKIYMEKVITCLQERSHGVLESPTGTGKTLCLLCSALAWRQGVVAQRQLHTSAGMSTETVQSRYIVADALHKATGQAQSAAATMDVPRIIYASRTHSQLTQVIQELKNTVYKPRVSILGSRDQLCIHPEVRKADTLTEKVHQCRARTASRACHFYNSLDDKKGDPAIVDQIMDIEDLVLTGAKNKVCPYYLARELRSTADIIFMPYNYILDTKTRQAFGIDLKNAVVLLDEAHNVERMCEDSSSFDLTSTDIASCISDLTRCIDHSRREREGMPSGDVVTLPAVENDEPVDDEKDFIALKHVLLNVEAAIDQLDLDGEGEDRDGSKGVRTLTKNGQFIFSLLGGCGITGLSKVAVLEQCDKAISLLTTQANTFQGKGYALQKFADAIRVVFNSGDDGPFSQVAAEAQAKFYKVHVSTEKKAPVKKGLFTTSARAGSGRVLSYWCFSPGKAMVELARGGIHCLLLTSGTLSPLESFTSEMQLRFNVRLENPHVIDKRQVWVGVLGKGPGRKTLNSSYANRSKDEYKNELGITIVNLCRIVPHGLLVFFPSYTVMTECIEHWQANGPSGRTVWELINKVKPAFVEPKGKADFTEIMDGFYEKIRDENHHAAAFFAVCRGKVSEGLDFADHNGRAVVITGLPFPPHLDPKIKLKMAYMNDMSRDKKNAVMSLTGQEWYRQQASRAVNQAIGRVIRHRRDFGAILLCDERFSSPDVQDKLPKWVRPHVQHFEEYGHLVRSLHPFFSRAESLVGCPPLRPLSKTKAQPTTAQTGTIVVSARQPVAGRRRLEWKQASDVEAHVASLVKDKRPRRRIEYDVPNVQEPRVEGDTLTLLEGKREAGRKPIDIYDPNPAKLSKVSSFSDSLLSVASSRPRHQRTIKLSARSAIIAEATPSVVDASAEEHASGTADHQALKKHASDTADHQALSKADRGKHAKDYMMKIRRYCSGRSDCFERFTACLSNYKRKHNLECLWSGLSELYEELDALDLLQEFAVFLRPEHKERYAALCQEWLDGKKRHECCGNSSNGDSSTAQLGSKNTKLGDPGSKAVIEQPDNCPQTARPEPTKRSSAGVDVVAMSADSSEVSGAASRLSSVLEKDQANVPSLSRGPSGSVCARCKKKGPLFEAPCHHMACRSCWTNTLKEKHKCFVCQAEVRKRNLRTVYFP